MAKGFKAQHFEDYSIVKGNVKVKLNLKQYGEKLQKAQYDLDGQIGKVCAGAPPMGRFLYGGKVMIGETSKSPWAMEDETKVLTDRDLEYANPDATAQWFETAKKNHMDDWVKCVEDSLKGN